VGDGKPALILSSLTNDETGGITTTSPTAPSPEPSGYGCQKAPLAKNQDGASW